ncbi:MAG TPA: hypothetical protein VE959_28390 [Bryobacteraceae bacterium]|nr:hypothetical protein [Bryobacteraceae bacterium]
MAIATIRRRVGALESVASLALIPDEPPLTLPELDALVRRLEEGDRFGGQELKRIERQGPICHGEFLIRVTQGKVFAKRYVGVDSAEI